MPSMRSVGAVCVGVCVRERVRAHCVCVQVCVQVCVGVSLCAGVHSLFACVLCVS